MQQSKYINQKEFLSLVPSFESCTFSSDSQGISNKFSGIVAVKTDCTIDEAYLILSLCPQLKKLTSININHLQNKGESKKADVQRLLYQSSLEHIGIRCTTSIEVKDPINKIKQLLISQVKVSLLKELAVKFPHLKKLQFLKEEDSATRDGLTDLIKTFKTMNSLRKLSFDYFHLGTGAIKAISELHQLEKLHLKRCTYDQGEIVLSAHLKQMFLEVYDKSRNFLLKFFEAISQNNIIASFEFYIGGWSRSQLLDFASNFSKYSLLIKSARFSSNCPNSLFEVIKNSPYPLQRFIWNHKGQVDYPLVKQLLSHQKHIVKLHLGSLIQNREAPLLSELTQLRQLQLSNSLLSDRGAIYLKKMKRLEILRVTKVFTETPIISHIEQNLSRAWKLQIHNNKINPGKRLEENTLQLRYFD